MVASSVAMLAILYAFGMFVADLFKSRSRLEAENLFLRHQLNLALQQEASSHSVAGQSFWGALAMALTAGIGKVFGTIV
jgi:hypothetical protein